MVSFVLFDPQRFRALLVCGWLLGVTPMLLGADLESTGITDAKTIAASSNRSDFFFVNTNGQLVQWNDGKQVVLVDNLGAAPALMSAPQALLCRDESVAAIGLRDGQLAFAGYRLTPQRTAEWQPGLSIPLKFLGPSKVTLVAATAANIYLVSQRERDYEIWRIKAGVATLGDPAKLHSSQAPLLAIVLNYQGHLLTAIRDVDQGQGKVLIRFHHAETGKPLLTLPTELDDLRSLVVGPDELLYAAATIGETTGLYRLDVAYRNRRQTIDARLLETRDTLQQLSCTTHSLLLLSDLAVQRLPLLVEETPPAP